MRDPTLRIIPWASLAVCVVVVVMITVLVNDVIFDSDQDRFEKIADHLTENIGNRMRDYDVTLHGAKGLLAGSVEVTRSEWKQYTSVQQIEKRLPGMQAFGYSKKIGSSEDLESHVQKMRLTYPEYDVHPKFPREEYHSIVYVEPFESSNLRVFGYDMSTEPVRKDAMMKAYDSDEVVFSRKITLMQETTNNKQPGFLMLLSIYKNGYPTDSVEQRRSALDGVVYFAFRAQDLFGTIIEQLEEDPNDMKNITIEVYDSSVSDSNLMYSNRLLPTESIYLQTVKTITLGKQQWPVKIYATNEFSHINEIVIPITIFVGLAMSLLLFLVIRSFCTNQLYILKLAQMSDDVLSEKFDVLIEPKGSKIDNATQRLFHTINQMRASLAKATMEKQIAQKKDEFSAMITHELKTPLMPLFGYSKLLLSSLLGSLNTEQKNAIELIYKNAKTLDSLINDILDAQKLDLKQMTYTIRPILVSDLFRSISSDYVPVLGDKIHFQINMPDDFVIQTDEIRLKQVFGNLINNAINAINSISKTNGMIEIGAKKHDNFVLFYVKNNGPPIPKDKQANLFQKFYQIDNSVRRMPGSGLGLAICRGIVEGLGGKIWLESDPNETVFYIRFAT